MLHGPELRYLMTQFVIGSGGGAEMIRKHVTCHYIIGHKVVGVYDSPAEIKEAGLSEITLEVSAVDSAEMMTRLV